MAKHACGVCGYLYDEAKEGGFWRDLPADWACPLCGAGKPDFVLVERGAAPERDDSAAGSRKAAVSARMPAAGRHPVRRTS